jgi:hypothetical protein
MAELMKAERNAGGVLAKCDTPQGLAQAIGLDEIL